MNSNELFRYVALSIGLLLYGLLLFLGDPRININGLYRSIQMRLKTFRNPFGPKQPAPPLRVGEDTHLKFVFSHSPARRTNNIYI